jgi:tetratricopeptide (TPR) repeat protein
MNNPGSVLSKSSRERPDMASGRGRALAVHALLLIAYVAALSVFRPAFPSSEAIAVARSRELAARIRLLLGGGRYEDALAPTQEIVRINPANQVYIRQLAGIYDHIGRPADAAAAWEQFVDHSPTPVEACPAIGWAYEKIGDTAKALDAHRRCVTFAPGDPDMSFYLGHAYERSGDLARAKEAYQAGLSLAPAYSDLQLGLARIDLREERPGEALRKAQEALARNAENCDALLVAGLASMRLKERTAQPYLEQGSSLCPKDPDFTVALATLARARGRVQEARRLYQKVLKDHPSHLEAREGLARLERSAP